jgi:hypothetical protein
MKDPKIRQAIAAEAARLMSQRKEVDFHSARRKAARWYSRERVSPADLPSFHEIQQQIFAQSGLFAAEQQTASLSEIRLIARELLELLGDFGPRLVGTAITGPVLPGAEIEIILASGSATEVAVILLDAGHRAELQGEQSLKFFHHFACVVWLGRSSDFESRNLQGWDIQQLDEFLDEEANRHQLDVHGVDDSEDFAADDEFVTDDEGYHPDFFPTLQMLLSSLEKVRLDPDSHPEGDLLYHSLQVYELVRAERPYDEELLLAALIHDVGYALDRRRPLEAVWNAIGALVTDRTWFFVENRAETLEYLRTGKARGTLRKSPDFDDLVLLAQCDLKGRQCGAQVSTIEAALNYIEGLGSAWDDA